MALNIAVAATVFEAGVEERPNSLLVGPRFADDFRGELSRAESSDSGSSSDCPSRVARPIRAESGSLESWPSDSDSADAFYVKSPESAEPKPTRTNKLRRKFSAKAALRALRARVRKTIDAL
ncbi:hypothetical protein FVE85_2489 [Porphyridium purpureum]|uniref:Uncharacterized protein n=1 Tax=Porphyridium purpureum TaxID=35688 RepID=A0A5J4YLA6_PORPP|nr:hypothetical protein FVE85_2489 [Porphyridium purpureum]|eukprot:POR3440..scf291_13